MFKKLSPKEKRTLTICLIACVLIFLYFLVFEPVSADWRGIRRDLKTARQKAALLKLDEKTSETQRQKRLLEMVPVLEMPGPAEVYSLSPSGKRNVPADAQSVSPEKKECA